ncbi:hypothetical protein [Microbacterium sorbitolivorans]|uniref:PKD domain-containing protein n=1 Tax=Microbacterium sorbitolivorans TaxID=1867410 RepID=A0A367Y644_9MICO|nr:hypothetical protein [Microbacterium sorbitolivorans]RCK61343.1 hypothetical protein DTO57_01440 [Microbacterium sorbitolivorans]
MVASPGDLGEIATCTQQDAATGLCDGNNEGDLDLEEFRPGNPGNPAPQNPNPNPNPNPQPGNNPGQPQKPNPGTPQQPANPNPDPGPANPDGGGWLCEDPGGGLLNGGCLTPEDPEEGADPDPQEPERPVIPPEIDQRDVASFAPQATSPTIEPFGVAIKNAPMNVAFSVEPHTVGGSLFELPVNVTFTPDIITIDYGDGTQAQVSGSAATWDGLGQQQLTPTGTSHTYGERGTVTVTVDVAYVATVDFGPWGVYPVSGHIVSYGSGTDVQVYEKQSYLVERTCREDPQGPGC